MDHHPNQLEHVWFWWLWSIVGQWHFVRIHIKALRKVEAIVDLCPSIVGFIAESLQTKDEIVRDVI